MPLREEWVSVALAAAAIFCMGGVIFGIASLYPVLYYQRALQTSSCSASNNECADRSPDKCCDEQQLQYTLMSSIALFAADGAMLLYGELGDRAGPRWCFGVGVALAWGGMGLLSLSASIGTDILWYAATLLIGISGPGVFMGCLFLGEKYPQVRAAISGVGASMWDASALVFMLFNTAYFATASESQLPFVGLNKIALGWMILCILIGVPTWQALPSRQLIEQLRASEPLSKLDAADGSQGTDDNPHQRSAQALMDESTESIARSNSFVAHFFRADTMLLLFFMASYNLKSSFFITTFAEQMSQMFPESTARSLATTFNIAFPVGGFVTSLGATMLLDKLGDHEDMYMTLVILLAIMFGVYNLLPFAASQYASALLFGPTRTLQWACYFHFLSLPKRYAPQFVGRLLGYGNLVIALAGDVPVSMLNAFVTNSDRLGSPAARYVLVHFALEMFVVASLALPWYLRHTDVRRIESHSSVGIDDDSSSQRRDDTSMELQTFARDRTSSGEEAAIPSPEQTKKQGQLPARLRDTAQTLVDPMQLPGRLDLD